MNENKRGVFLGCAVLLALPLLFIGLPVFIYLQYFQDDSGSSWSLNVDLGEGGDHKAYLELGENALIYEEPQKAIAYADSALAQQETAQAYYITFRAYVQEEDLGGMRKALEGILYYPEEEERMFLLPRVLGYLTDDRYKPWVKEIVEDLAYITEQDDVIEVYEELASYNETWAPLFLLQVTQYNGADQELLDRVIIDCEALDNFPCILEANKKLLELDRSDAVVLNNIGYYFYQMGEVDSANKYFLEAAELGNTSAENNLSNLKDQKGSK